MAEIQFEHARGWPNLHGSPYLAVKRCDFTKVQLTCQYHTETVVRDHYTHGEEVAIRLPDPGPTIPTLRTREARR